MSIKEQVLFHLGYEWWMFRATDALLQNLPPNAEGDPVRNALVESLHIHGRALIDFFYKAKTDKTDWVVDDLNCGVTTIEISAGLKAWRKNTNKRVAHLTDTRTISCAQFEVATTRKAIYERIGAVRKALGAAMPKDWHGDDPIDSRWPYPQGPQGADPSDDPNCGSTGTAQNKPINK
jgi:hypothetical protein